MPGLVQHVAKSPLPRAFQGTAWRRVPWLLVTGLLCLASEVRAGGWDQAQATFDRARQQSTAGEHAEAKRLYGEAALAFAALHEDEGVHSAKLFVNAGNAFVFAENPGRAAVYYRRALLLEPANPRALAGLQHVRSSLPWVERSSVGADLLGTLFFWHAWLSFAARRGLFLILWPLACGVLLAARRRRILLALGVPLLLGGAALFGSLAVSASSDLAEEAAVLVLSVEGRTGDGRSYSPSHSSPLPAGTEVVVLEARTQRPDPWLHVALPDGSQAWVPASTAERLVPAPQHEH